MRECAVVVGQQEQSFAVEVEPSSRIDILLGDEIRERRRTFAISELAEHAVRACRAGSVLVSSLSHPYKKRPGLPGRFGIKIETDQSTENFCNETGVVPAVMALPSSW